MNNRIHIIPNAKAGLFTCLFLSLVLGRASGQAWQFDASTQRAYDLALNLQTDEALLQLGNPETAEQLYVASLAEAIDLFASEDEGKYERYHIAYSKRLEAETKSSRAAELFLRAEMRLQWTFIYLKFGHELDAAWNLRQSYMLAQECRNSFPDFQPVKKTSGLLNVIIGAVPPRYNWLLGLFGVEGSVDQGLADLTEAARSGDPSSFESSIIHALVQGHILQRTQEAVTSLMQLQKTYPQNRIVRFLSAAVCLKNSQSEEALPLLESIEQDTVPVLPFVFYLLGEAYLHKGDYQQSIVSYQKFIRYHKGQNYLKDASYKTGICYLLTGNKLKAEHTFSEARGIGKESGEADRYAAWSMTNETMPDVDLAKARYYTDGGYYEKALRVLEETTPAHLDRQLQAEYYYRKARLSHKTGDVREAVMLYKKVIDLCPDDDTRYFAPNACLQLGYLMMDEIKTEAAQGYFRRAMQYQRHPYKNSIDSKAKSALNQLKSRK